MKVVAFYSYGVEMGKDTAADMLADELGGSYRVYRTAFANEMKIVCADALGLPSDWTDRQKIEEVDRLKLHGIVSYRVNNGKPGFPDGSYTSTGQAGRDFIIGLAESVRRLDPGFWIRHTLGNQRAMRIHNPDFIVISDLRFRLEAEAVRNVGGMVVEIVRSFSRRVNEDRLPTHLIDYAIPNDGSLEDLRQRVDTFVDRRIGLDGADQFQPPEDSPPIAHHPV